MRHPKKQAGFIDFFLSGWFLVFLILLLLFCGFMAISSDREQKADFMEECLQDRKPYECTAMWRAGEPNTTVIPMVIPVGR